MKSFSEDCTGIYVMNQNDLFFCVKGIWLRSAYEQKWFQSATEKLHRCLH